MAEQEVRNRLRRTNSTSRAEDIVTEDAKVINEYTVLTNNWPPELKIQIEWH